MLEVEADLAIDCKSPLDRWSVHVAELIGIFYAVNMVFKLVHQRSIVGNSKHITATKTLETNRANESSMQPSKQPPRFKEDT